MHGADDGEPSGWTRRQDKLLELLLCRMFPRWDRIAAHLGDKTPEQVRERYASMVAGLRHVLEAPRVETPPEWDRRHRQAAAPRMLLPVIDAAAWAGGEEDAADAPADDKPASATGAVVGKGTAAPACMAAGEVLEKTAKHKSGRRKREECVGGRNRAVPWTTDEHKLFLAGIREHGTGKWQKLSREFVTTRNASQIASHYQKYTIRQAKLRRQECKRPSIHDINDDTLGVADRRHDNPATTICEEERRMTDDESPVEDEVAVGELPSNEHGHKQLLR